MNRKPLVRRILLVLGLFLLGFSTVSPVFAQTEPVFGTFNRNLTVGSVGSDVSTLQEFLIGAGFLRIPSPTAYLGTLTSAAIAAWQTVAGLPATGFFGPLSRTAILESTAVASAATTPVTNVAPAITSEAIMATAPAIAPTSDNTTYDRNLTIGDTGTDVSALQLFLINKGFLDVASPTGLFGSLTASALSAWQASVGLPATGFFGPMSRTAIENSPTTVTKVTPNVAPAVTPAQPSFNGGGAGGGGGGAPAIAPAVVPAIIPSAPATGSGGGNTGGGGGGGGGIVTSQADTTAPVISITSPGVNSTTVSGNVTVTASASDNVGVTKVEFYVGTTFGASLTQAPYTWIWNTATSTNGAHAIGAIAYDAAGNKTSAASDWVTVSNATTTGPDTTPPTISIATPIVNSIVAGNVLVTALASDNVGVSHVDFYIGGTFDASVTKAPYVWTWNSLNSTNATHTIGAIAYDAAGNKTSAKSILVTVNNISTIAPQDAKFGLSSGEYLMGLGTTTLDKDLDDLVSLGVGWIRFDMQWDHVQMNNSTDYDWANIDQLVTEARARNIKLLAVLDYTPTWDASSKCTSGSDRCLPKDDSAYNTFVTAAVSRYKGQVGFWEVWNEPNLKNATMQSGDASAYATLLKGAYSAIKAVDPTSFVVSGGTAPATSTGGNIAPIDFLTQLYADGAGKSFDAVGFHPYSIPAMPNFPQSWNAWQQMSVTNPSLRSVMIANGDTDKHIWMTEYGAATNGPGVVETSASDTIFAGHPDHVTEALQATMLTSALTSAATYSWAGPLFIYSYQDLGTSPTTIENFFGLYRFDGSTKPSYTAIKALLL